MVWIDTFSSQL